jgi:hypothetical protein
MVWSRVLLDKLTVPQLVQKLPRCMQAAVHYLIHNSLTLVTILNQINTVHALPPYFSTIHLNVILQYMPRSSSGTNNVIKQTFINKVQQQFNVHTVHY